MSKEKYVPFVPALSSNASIIINKAEIVGELVRFYIYNPGNTSSSFNNELISLRLQAAKTGNDKNSMILEVQNSLLQVLSRYFDGDSISVNCSANDIDSVRYTLVIDIRIDTVDGNIPILYKGLVDTSDDGEFILKVKDQF